MALHASTCPLDCPDACGVLVETDAAGDFLRVKGNPAHSWSRGALCGKTAIYGEVVTSAERLKVPLLRRGDGSFEQTSWERAIERIAERVRPLAGEDVLALPYAGNMGLVSRQYPARVLNALGAVEHDAGICDASAKVGYQIVMGHVIGADLEEVEACDLLVLWGCDAMRTHQHLLPRLRRLCRRGVPVIAIDVYRTDTIRALERWGGRGLVLHPGTDAALALALAERAFAEGAADLEFLRRECVGAAAFRAELAGWSLERAQEITGLELRAIRDFADVLFAAREPFIKTGVGWTRRRNGGMSMRAVCSLAAVLGRADRLHFESADHFALDDSVVSRPDLRPADAPTEPVTQVALGRELETGRFRACFVWGHNPAATLPDSRRVRAGLARDDLFLVVHELFMTETARLADVVLPATAFVEHSDVLRSYGHRVLHYARKAVDAPHEQRCNVDTFSAIARALGLAPEVWDVSPEGLCEELLAASRERFTTGELERLFAGEPVKLAPRDLPDRGTPSGRIELESQTAKALGEPACATYVPDDGAGCTGRYWFVPAPSTATHNSTYTHSPRHVERAGAPVCLLNPGDAKEHGLADGELVRLSNEQGTLTLPIASRAEVPRGMVRVDGFLREESIPEAIGVNALTSPATSDLGAGNVLYSARVDLTPLR